jgi:hypothetical protein
MVRVPIPTRYSTSPPLPPPCSLHRALKLPISYIAHSMATRSIQIPENLLNTWSSANAAKAHCGNNPTLKKSDAWPKATVQSKVPIPSSSFTRAKFPKTAKSHTYELSPHSALKKATHAACAGLLAEIASNTLATSAPKLPTSVPQNYCSTASFQRRKHNS